MSTFNKNIETFAASVSEKIGHIAEEITSSIKHIMSDFEGKEENKDQHKDNKICTDEIADTFNKFADEITKKFGQLAIDIKEIVKHMDAKPDSHDKKDHMKEKEHVKDKDHMKDKDAKSTDHKADDKDHMEEKEHEADKDHMKDKDSKSKDHKADDKEHAKDKDSKSTDHKADDKEHAKDKDSKSTDHKADDEDMDHDKSKVHKKTV